MKNFPKDCVVILTTQGGVHRIAHVKNPNEFFYLERERLHWLGLWMKNNFDGAACSKYEDAEKMAGDIATAKLKLGVPVSGVITIDASKYDFPLI